MKSASFTLDRHLYELLQEEGRTKFTTLELRDAYAKTLEGISFRIADVRRYVYEQIRRLVRTGWIVLDEDRRTRGQVYLLRPIPAHLKIELVDGSFEKCIRSLEVQDREPELLESRPLPDSSSSDADRQLEALHKEIRLDFLSSMGETERYKLLLNEIPQLRSSIEADYQEAKDRSSCLLGHLRAIEKTLKMLASTK